MALRGVKLSFSYTKCKVPEQSLPYTKEDESRLERLRSNMKVWKLSGVILKGLHRPEFASN